MSMIRTAFAPALAFVLLMVITGTALAGNSHRGHHVDRSLKAFLNVEGGSEFWVVPSLVGGPLEDGVNFQCSGIPEGIEVTPVENGSVRLKTAFVKSTRPNGRKKNGRKKVILDDLVFGKATDQHGHKYFFIYKNTTTITSSMGVAHVNMIDSFWMRGKKTNYVVSFDWDWKYHAPQGIKVFVDEFNLGATPFVFGTDDGLTESMSEDVIPGSWVQNETNGFVFGCDPI